MQRPVTLLRAMMQSSGMQMHELMQRCDADAINKTGADSGMLMQEKRCS
jgi:hypothetical protein